MIRVASVHGRHAPLHWIKSSAHPAHHATGAGLVLAALLVAGCASKVAVEQPPAQPVELGQEQPLGSQGRAKTADRERALQEAPAAPADGSEGLADYAGLLSHRAARILRSEDLPDPSTLDIKVVNDEPFDAMYFKHYGVNPTIDTAEEAISTFSADVDRGSFNLTRAYLHRGHLPPAEAVRVEEFVNAFDYDYEPPRHDVFSLSAEAFPSPNRPGYHVLHLGLRGIDVPPEARAPANLVFVIDTSGSMNREDRLEQVKRSLFELVDQLRRDDSVAIVEYGNIARTISPPTAGDRRRELRRAIASLKSNGSTNAAAGLELAYELIQQRYNSAHTNRIILCSDGVANTGPATDADGILQRIRRQNRAGIHLTTIGFGMGNYNDVLMEQLAQHGGGNYYYVDSPEQSRRLFVEDLTGTLQVIAEDLKIQVEFDPHVISRYRLIGYENRALDTEDFANDQIDAVEIGAGHAVTALYEIKFRQGVADFGHFRARFKEPGHDHSRLVERRLPAAIVHARADAASAPTRLAHAVSLFAEKLREAYWVRKIDYALIDGLLNALPERTKASADVTDLVDLVRRSAHLDSRPDRFAKLDSADFDRVPVLRR